MGKIFKTPKDDSVEETLRAMHLANTVDNVYEWGYGWIRTVVVATVSVFILSAVEANSDFSLWESTVEWFYFKLEQLGNWLVDLG
jgi:hypothetical protein|tara:strand:- start:335 stop:589 length:255 start_codon:yes stop_codon:yes gene_type:complete